MAEVPKLNSFTTRIVSVLKASDLFSRKDYPVSICPCFLKMTVNNRSAYIQGKQLCSKQATIDTGIVQAVTTVSLARIGITRCCIETAVLLLCRIHPTLQGQYPPQIHTQIRHIQSKFSKHLILLKYLLCIPYKMSLLQIIHPNIGFHFPP